MNNDPREICVLHANCQGEPLAQLLALSPEFAARWVVHTYTNYTREMIPDFVLKNATLFLYQHLGPEWGDVSSDALLARTGRETRPVCIPNMFFLGYWPFWTKASPMDFGDFFLDKLHEAGAGKPEILRIYLEGDIRRMVDLEAVVRHSLSAEFAKEERCAVKTAGFVAENWKKIRLFQTVNHPDVPLLLYTAQGLLVHLGLPPLSDAVCAHFTFDYEGFALPIHPKVARYHALPFADAETLYPVFGRNLTFIQYISRYIDCRDNHLEDSFLAYLHMI